MIIRIEGELLKKLESAGIEVVEVEKSIIDDEGLQETRIISTAKFPCGREFKDLRFNDRVDINTYIESEFEHYRFVKDYEAVWSSKHNVIECELQPVSRTIIPSSYLMKRMFRSFGVDTDEISDDYRFNFIDKETGHTVSIGYASSEFALLACSTTLSIPYDRYLKRPTLKIENIELQNHDQAKGILEKVGNALLFKLDLTANVGFKLSHDREIRRAYLRPKNEEPNKDLSFPSYEYDSEPMSLYWYAKSATDMPLLQFLALYQILEFYFPVFSRQEAHHQIKNIIKDPRFNPNKDSDITRVLSAITQNKNQLGFGSELEQLKSTLSSCVIGEEIREQILNDQDMLAFFKDKKAKKLSGKIINAENKATDLIGEIAERIYEIRCRVVHTKASDKNYDLLIPSSPELKHLRYDISVLEAIAKKVLISTSRVLKL